jgi:hypothetical protein
MIFPIISVCFKIDFSFQFRNENADPLLFFHKLTGLFHIYQHHSMGVTRMSTPVYSIFLAFEIAPNYHETKKELDIDHEHPVCGYIKKTQKRKGPVAE